MDKKQQDRPGQTATDLRGRQSVRATFKLTQKAIEAMQLVALHLGIKQKSLFDHLIEDPDELTQIAGSIRMRTFNRMIRVQKTFVLSRRTLEAIEMMSKRHDTPRDALVEYSIQRLQSVIEMEKKKHAERKRLLENLNDYVEKGRELLAEAQDLLGEGDPFCKAVESAVAATQRATEEMEAFVERSRVIEDY